MWFSPDNEGYIQELAWLPGKIRVGAWRDPALILAQAPAPTGWGNLELLSEGWGRLVIIYPFNPARRGLIPLR